jgi:glucose-1-phosphate adenylyltransferase
MVAHAEATDADLVIAAHPVDEQSATRMGNLRINQSYEVIDFCEKPQEKRLLDAFRCEEVIAKLPGNKNSSLSHLGSMGIYLFKKEALFKLLEVDPREDFGKHLIPNKVKQGNVSAFLYSGYWEDIGTLQSYYNANIGLTNAAPAFDCYNESRPIHTTRDNLAGPKFYNVHLENSIICEGSVLEEAKVSRSILGPRTIIKNGTVIESSYLIGNDLYSLDRNSIRASNSLKIGENCLIRRAILDSNVSMGNNVQLINKNQILHYTGDKIVVRDGIITVPRNTHLPDGFVF